ncbi:uncharacterized protein [Mytilus edulis]|uniref:uncharacterized protein isoform X1 n=1 Tax=Mytilus edulis TaxID=6550 RepID=UPI0039EE5095
MFKVIFIVSTSLYVASGNKNIQTFNIKADVHGGSIKEDIVVDLQKKLLIVNVGSVALLNSDCPSTINLHDFKKGKLGIKNIDTGECLMIDTRESLNATLELLYKIKRLKLTHVIDEVKLVDPVPITEQEMLQEGGEYIADFCSGYKLFFGNIVGQNVHHAETRIKRAGKGSSKYLYF